LNNTTDATTGAWLTPQHGIDVVTGATLDFGGQNVTIQLASGTYGVMNLSSPWTGGGTLSILGDTTTPTNVVIQGDGSNNCLLVTANLPGNLILGGFKPNNCMFGINVQSAATILVPYKMNYGSASAAHIFAGGIGSLIWIQEDYTISADASMHWETYLGGIWNDSGLTLTLSGSRSFDWFAASEMTGAIYCYGFTFSGSATGKRYYLGSFGIIETYGSGATYLPGDDAGEDYGGYYG
jgi:hypothetical protein